MQKDPKDQMCPVPACLLKMLSAAQNRWKTHEENREIRETHEHKCSVKSGFNRLMMKARSSWSSSQLDLMSVAVDSDDFHPVSRWRLLRHNPVLHPSAQRFPKTQLRNIANANLPVVTQWAVENKAGRWSQALTATPVIIESSLFYILT